MIQRALHTTSDFPQLSGNAVGRVLRDAYVESPSPLKSVSSEITLPDFRARGDVSLSSFSDLERVNEHGEFKRGTFTEIGEKIALETFGKIFGASRQLLVNDDLVRFSTVPQRLGQSAARFEADRLV